MDSNTQSILADILFVCAAAFGIGIALAATVAGVVFLFAA